MKITLLIDGEMREFYSHGITAGASRMALKLGKEYDEKKQAGGDSADIYTEEYEEKLLRFITRLFNKQFTEQQFDEGYLGSFYKLFPGILTLTIHGLNDKVQEFIDQIEQDPNAEAPTATEE